MKKHKIFLFYFSALVALESVGANENIVYSYDSEGRLVATSRSGTVNNGVIAQQTYDRADNRSNLIVSGSTNSPPNPGNTPPIAVNNAATFASNGGGAVYVIGNDSDANGDPLTIIAVSVVSGPATASNAGNGNISVGMNNSTVQTVISYSISDGNGGTATAQLVVTPGPKMPFGGAC